MEKLADRFLAVALMISITAIGCFIGAVWHWPFVIAAHLLVACAGSAGAGMVAVEACRAEGY